MEEEEEREAPARKIPLRLVRNVKRTDSKAVVLITGGEAGERGSSRRCQDASSSSVLAEVRQIAANKMRIPLANLQLFNTRGEEFSATDQQHAVAQITNGATLYVSAGEACAMDKSPDKRVESAPSGGAVAGSEVTVLAKESFVDHQAIAQLKSAAGLPHVFVAVGLPDLHVGALCPKTNIINIRVSQNCEVFRNLFVAFPWP